MTNNMNHPAFATPRSGSRFAAGQVGLTTRDYAAIHLRIVPEPGESLDDLIRRAERRDVAVALAAADAGHPATCCFADEDWELASDENVLKAADALLAALRETKEPKP